MFDKFQDALVVLVFFYMVYRVGWGSGMTAINTFMLLCAVVALISIALKRTGYLDRMKEKKLEEERKLEEEKKEAKEEFPRSCFLAGAFLRLIYVCDKIMNITLNL